MKYANLHLHSNHSDAEFTPEQLLLIGKSIGYSALALTDHETDNGTLELMKAARPLGVHVMAGVEFDGVYEDAYPHIVALDYDMDEPGIRAFIKERVDIQCARTKTLFEYGTKIGVIDGFSWDDVVKYNPDGAWLCINSVYNTYKTLKLKAPDNLRDAVWKSDFAKSTVAPRPKAEDIIKVIRNAGGVAVLAHPNNQTRFIPKLVEAGLNGVEVSHPGITAETISLAEEMAKEYNLYCCGGTDHSGPMSGCGGRHAFPTFAGITEEQFTILRERKLG